MTVSSCTMSALTYLKSVKPHDGWAVETSSRGVRLLRRSIPLSDTWFQDLALSQQRSVVGIMHMINAENNLYKTLVLVEANGIPARWQRNLILQLPNTTSSSSTPTPQEQERLSDEENIQILMYAIYAIAAMMVMKVFVSAAFMLYLTLFPMAYFYALSSCPSMESFHAKQQIKRVLRGHDLPEDHPDKPKGWINRAVAKVQASVTTELAMSTGYEVSMFNVIGACTVASVRVPSAKTDLYWIGIFGKWRFLWQTEIPTNKLD